jgi:hypothetical protein
MNGALTEYSCQSWGTSDKIEYIVVVAASGCKSMAYHLDDLLHILAT